MRSRCQLVAAFLFTFTPALYGEDTEVVEPQKSYTLDPKDIGIAKYVFEASPPAGKVMVVRCTKFSKDGEAAIVSEKIDYTDGEKNREVVLVFDPTKFPFNPDQATPQDSWITHPGGTFMFQKKRLFLQDWGGKVLELGFTNDDDEKERAIFECFIEDYATAKARVPDLPAERPGGGWGYNTFILPKKK